MTVSWRGVFPAVCTQFRPDDAVDVAATLAHVDALLTAGVHGLVMLGSVGENTALDPAEKRELFGATVKHVGRRVPVLTGVAEYTTAGACRWAAEAARLGADGLMVLPPMVYKPDDRELVAHFRAVAKATDRPIMVYNNPPAYKADITPELFAELADEPKFACIKESSDNPRRITDIVNLTGDRYVIFAGVDDLFLECLMLGAVGWVSGLVNAFPAENRLIWDLAAAGRWAEALAVYRWYTPLLHLDTHVKLVQYIKLAAAECGYGSERCRPPRLPLVGAERERVLGLIRTAKATRPFAMHRIQVIDSHTGGEPTRVVIAGGPDLGPGTVADRARVFRERFDAVRSAVVCEPRGSDVLVGALLVEPADRSCAAGVIFFNNVGLIGMCGHGTIGLAVTLAHLGRLAPGDHRIETPVGVVTATLHDRNRVTVRNVPSYRHRAGVTVEVPGHGPVTGDVAWGGNWFFLTADHGQELLARHAEHLTGFAWRVRRAIEAAGVTGEAGGVIDHIELVGPPADPANHARNFVLCPGGAYDRSPCGTGTSAKLACLVADGKLRPGDVWRQESVIGSVFEGSVEPAGGPGQVLPSITGTAYVTAEATLLLDPADPLRDGLH